MSGPRQIALLALNDLRLTVKERASFLWLLVLPLIFMWIFGNMGGGGGGPRKVALTVDNRDGGWLAAALVAELQDDQLEIRPAAAPGSKASPEQKPPARTLVIPPGFTAGALAGRQQTIRLEKAPGSDEENGLAAQAVATRAVVRTLARLAHTGVILEEAARDGGTAADVEDPAAQRAVFGAVASWRPLITVASSTAGAGHAVPKGLAQSVPGTLTFFVLIMTTIYGAVFLTIEKREGMIRRMAALPLGRRRIFLGKLAGRLLIAGTQIAIYLAAGRFIYGVSWGSSPAGLALVLGSYAFAVAGLSILLGALASRPEQASAVGWLASMVLGAMGGCWWPGELMPRWLWNAAHAFPTAWAMDALHSLVSFGRGVEAVLIPAAALCGFGVIFCALGARFLRYD